MWFCPTCKNISKNVAQLKDTVTQLQTTVNEHVDTIKRQQTMNTALAKMTDTLQTRIQDLESKISEQKDSNKLESLTRAKTPNAAKQLEHDTKPENRTLLIGDSMIQDVNSKGLSSVKVTCIRGGKVSAIKKELQNTKVEAFEAIVIHVGTNDCSGTDEIMEQGASEYETLIEDINKRAPNSVKVVSSVIPRGDQHQKRVAAFNAKIRTTAENTGCLFVDHDTNFKLKDDTVDPNMLKGKLHLTRNGTSRFLKNINANHEILKAKPTSVPTKNSNDNSNDSRHHEAQRNGYTHTWTPVQRRNQQNTSRNYHVRGNDSRHHEAQKNGNTRTWTPVQRRNQQNTSRNYHVRGTNSQPRCFYCYESNHMKDNCRHKKPATCYSCGLNGHKARLCEIFHAK
jgi:hypothetical protein